MPALASMVESSRPGAVAAPGRRTLASPVVIVIAVATVIGLALRVYQLARPGYLFGPTEYDDGVDFGSAVQLVHGAMPYRDFVLIQPPGITLLMAPVALLTKGAGTAWGMAVARITTVAAGAASVPLGGLLVRHRGAFATTVTCGILAVFPTAIQADHTLMLEPWLVLFCLLGLVAVFDGDRLVASARRLAWGGLAFGLAGAVKVWAILPVLVVLVMLVRARGRLAAFGAGVAVGFLAPAIPFLALGPGTFWHDVVVAQLQRVDVARASIWYRVHELTGLTDWAGMPRPVLALGALAIIALIGAAAVLAWRSTRQLPAALERFALATAALVALAFLWPADFYYHYAAFIAPFVALAVALPLSRALPSSRIRELTALAWVTVLVMAGIQASTETRRTPPLAFPEPSLKAGVVSSARRIIPAGACVLTDQTSFTIAANRFATARGCSRIVDGVGTDYALSNGHNGVTGAGASASVRARWLRAFRGAQYVWLSLQSSRRIPWVAPITRYFASHFEAVRVGFTVVRPHAVPSGLFVRRSAIRG